MFTSLEYKVSHIYRVNDNNNQSSFIVHQLLKTRLTEQWGKYRSVIYLVMQTTRNESMSILTGRFVQWVHGIHEVVSESVSDKFIYIS